MIVQASQFVQHKIMNFWDQRLTGNLGFTKLGQFPALLEIAQCRRFG
jgi:hypothetical protein